MTERKRGNRTCVQKLRKCRKEVKFCKYFLQSILKKGVAFWQQLIYNTICVEEHETQKQKNARLAQLVEHLTLNQGVKGSNP